MLCPKCRSIVKDKTKICPYCDINIKKYKEALIERKNNEKEEINELKNDALEISSTGAEEQPITDNLNSDGKYYDDYVSKVDTGENQKTFRAMRDERIKKLRVIIPVSFVSILLVIGIVMLILGKNEIYFDDSFKDIVYDDVIATKLKYKIKLKRGNTKKVVFTSDCGFLHFYNGEVLWDLEEDEGSCEIIAQYKKMSISKKVNVVPNVFDKTPLLFERIVEKGIYDSDLDGLSDYDEINKYNTDPTNVDTDNDGLSDYNEIKLNTDPNNYSSVNNKTKDGNLSYKYNIKNKEAILNVDGYGNVADTKINIISKDLNRDGVYNKIYNIYSTGSIFNSELIINYSKLKLDDIKEDDLCIFIYNPSNNNYQKTDSKLDKKNKTITLKKIIQGYYVIGDVSKVVIDSKNQQLVDLIDINALKALVISDSKFDLKKHSLINENYKSIDNQNGHSFGIHMFVKDFYNNNLDLSKTNISQIDLHSYVYGTDELKYILGFDIFGEELYKDILAVEGNNLAISQKYKEIINSSGLFKIMKNDYLKSNKLGIASYESILLNDKSIDKLSGDDKYIISRFSDNKLSFNDNSNNNKDFVNRLNKSFNKNKIVVLGFNSKDGFNVVNGISLNMDLDQNNIYYVGVYDINYKNEKRFLKIRCNISNMCLTMKNEYYDTEDAVVYLNV